MADGRLTPLQALLRVRRVGVIEARRHLAARLDAQTRAEIEAAEIEHRMAHEARMAADLSLGDLRVEAYGRWLAAVRCQASAAAAERARTQAETTVARARLAAARAAAEAVDTVVDRHEATAEAAAARREQAIIDELTRSPHSPW